MKGQKTYHFMTEPFSVKMVASKKSWESSSLSMISVDFNDISETIMTLFKKKNRCTDIHLFFQLLLALINVICVSISHCVESHMVGMKEVGAIGSEVASG